MLLRCREGAGFTTIDLLRLDRSTGEAALYKYGAAPSYLKKLGRVTRYGGAALPAGLEGVDRQPDVIRFVLPPDGWLVMVSDGVVGGDGDEWLQDLLGGPTTAPCWCCTGCGAKKMAPRRYNPPPRRPYYYRRPMR